MKLPRRGMRHEDVLERMREKKAADADWRGGRTWSLIYPAGEEVDRLLRDANLLYLYENALNPFRFPSLRAMEVDVVDMTTDLLHGGPESAGAMTSGGTESILMAAKTARDRARAERGVTQPQMLVPYSAHPAFAKACSYLGIEQVTIPLQEDFRADVAAARERVSDRTVLIAGSAPCYPFGVVDPIEELAALAANRATSTFTPTPVSGASCLPFFERLGIEVPPFDFRVPGVTTDLGRRAQVRLRHQGRLGDRPPNEGAASTSFQLFKLQRLARRRVRLICHGGGPPRGAHRGGLGRACTF